MLTENYISFKPTIPLQNQRKVRLKGDLLTMKTEHSVLKVILRTVKQNKGMCVTLFAAVLGSAVFALLPPLVLAKAIDYLTAGQTFLLLWLCPILDCFY